MIQYLQTPDWVSKDQPFYFAISASRYFCIALIISELGVNLYFSFFLFELLTLLKLAPSFKISLLKLVSLFLQMSCVIATTYLKKRQIKLQLFWDYFKFKWLVYSRRFVFKYLKIYKKIISKDRNSLQFSIKWGIILYLILLP